LVYPYKPLPYYGDTSSFIKTLEGLDFKAGLRELNHFVKERDELVPPLISNYMQLSRTMKTFGTAMNSDFGDVEETGILVSIGDIYEEKRERYMKPYLEEKASR
jgi:hypothetical protein